MFDQYRNKSVISGTLSIHNPGHYFICNLSSAKIVKRQRSGNNRFITILTDARIFVGKALQVD